MSARFEELDRRSTSMGEVSLRRRLEPTLEVDVYEAKLGDEFLMSSLFTASEVALADLALSDLGGADLDVVVGGLGLGYTAATVLEDPRVRSLHVVEALGEVIEWHRRELLPLSSALRSDPRCHLHEGDFFALIAGEPAGGEGLPRLPDRSHAVLVDIDHTPRHLLHPRHAAFYTAEGMRRLAGRLHDGGVFALWSDDRPDDADVAVIEEAFSTCTAHVVAVPNPATGGEGTNTVYVASNPRP